MIKNLYSLIEFVTDRVSAIESDTLQKNRVYQEMIRESLKLEELIAANLPKEQMHLLLDYEDLQFRLELFLKEQIYRQGVSDGATTRRLKSKVKGSVEK